MLTSVVNLGELLRGIFLLPAGRRQRELLEWFEKTVPGLDAVLPVTRHAAERFAQIDAALTKKGAPIPVNDVWVAAVALDNEAAVVTNDEHFLRVDGLRVESWSR